MRKGISETERKRRKENNKITTNTNLLAWLIEVFQDIDIDIGLVLILILVYVVVVELKNKEANCKLMFCR